MIENKDKNKDMLSEIEFDILNNLYKHIDESLFWQSVFQKYNCSLEDIQLLLKKMIKKKIPIEEIIELTELTKEEIEKLK